MKFLALLLVALLPFACAIPKPINSKVSALRQYFEDVAPLYALNDPAGTYEGSKSILGETVTITVVVNSATSLSIVFTGPLALNCPDEAYAYSNPTITLPNIGVAGDCLHDALQANDVTLESITYATASDSVTIKAKYTFLNLEFDLAHVPSSHKRILPIRELFDQRFNAYALRNPDGAYHADQNIFGLEVTSDITVDATDFNFDIDAPISVGCNSEAYSMNGNEIVITNFNSPSDCMSQLSSTWSVTLDTIDYDAVGNSLVAKVSFAGLPLTLTYSHTASSQKSKKSAQFETREQFVNALRSASQAHNLEDPAGKYHGTKEVLGQKVDTTLTINTDGTLNFVVTGVVSINCVNEPYTFANNQISLTNLAKAGDCVHDALAANSVSLTSIAYAPTSDSVTVDLKYSFIVISLELAHVPSLGQLVAQRYDQYFVADPKGGYKGSKSFIGQTVTITATFDDSAKTFDLSIVGSITTECKQEPYTYAGGVISVTNINNSNDCIKQALDKNEAKFQSISYDTSADEITFTVSFLGIGVSVTLKHI